MNVLYLPSCKITPVFIFSIYNQSYCLSLPGESWCPGAHPPSNSCDTYTTSFTLKITASTFNPDNNYISLKMNLVKERKNLSTNVGQVWFDAVWDWTLTVPNKLHPITQSTCRPEWIFTSKSCDKVNVAVKSVSCCVTHRSASPLCFHIMSAAASFRFLYKFINCFYH